MTYLSPIIGYLFDPNEHDTYFSIMNFNPNDNKSIVIDKIVMTVEKANQRTERSFTGVASCWLMPILSIYNYIVQGRCNQVDRFVANVSDFLTAVIIRYCKFPVRRNPYLKLIPIKRVLCRSIRRHLSLTEH